MGPRRCDFAALLGSEEHGRWLICPAEPARRVSRRYRDGTLILETDFHTDDGAVRVIDFMPLRNGRAPQLVRIVEGLSGEVAMRMEFAPRLDYGSLTPWVEPAADGILALGGPNALHLSTTAALHAEGAATVADFRLRQGVRERFSLMWYPSYGEQPPVEDPDSALARTEAWWREWSSRCTYSGHWGDQVQRSLITLKALTDEETGAIVAAPTTSLPEELGGSRNWDYRHRRPFDRPLPNTWRSPQTLRSARQGASHRPERLRPPALMPRAPASTAAAGSRSRVSSRPRRGPGRAR